jgi:hypothetical protein
VTAILEIDAPDRVLPGDWFAGTVRWELAATPASASLRLVWRTAGAGARDEQAVEVVDVAALPSAEPTAAVGAGPYRGAQAIDALAPRPLAARDARRFRLRAPLAPPSFRGALIRLDWRLELAAGGATATRPLVISPAAAPLALP